MDSLKIMGLIASMFGGVIVAAANWLFMGADREKKRADAELSRAQAAKTRAETTELMKKPRTETVKSEVWGEPPKGWLAGDMEGASSDYVVGVDRNKVHSGNASAYIRATVEDPEGFGALSQRFKAGSFADKRLRLAGYLRVESVEGWAGLWMRIDASNGELEGFDNMENRPVRGTSDWVRREVILNVPADAHAVAIGALLVGSGQVWIDDFVLDVVGNDVPTTVEQEFLAESPLNLNFETSL
jgi:hypothetical protein